MNCICGLEIPNERWKLGYRTCIKCSTAKKYGCIHVFSGKTADTIQIIKDLDLARRLNNMQKRPGYAVAKGMYQSAKRR